MIKVGLVTNWNERCGVADYAEKLISYATHFSDVTFKKIGGPFTLNYLLKETENVDVIHINYAQYIFQNMPQIPMLTNLPNFFALRNRGQKLMLTFHDSSEHETERVSKIGMFDTIVTHEPTSSYPKAVHFIPQPLYEVNVEEIKIENKIGSAGPPFPWKGFKRMAEAASNIGMSCLAIFSNPSSDKLDIEEEKKKVISVCPDAEVKIQNWWKHEDIVRRLAECKIIAFPYDTDMKLYGISAAVRFGLAARRSVIVSRCSHFRDLQNYEDEVYFIEKDKDLESSVRQVLSDIEKGREKIPNRVIKDISWSKCAQMYVDLYKTLCKY